MKQSDNWHLTEALDYEHGRGDPFAAAVRATRMPMVITDPAQDDNPIVFCNVAFQKLTGYAREEIIGRNCRFLQGPQTDPQTVGKVRWAIENGHDIDVDLLNYRKDGSTFWNALYLSPVRDKDGVIRFFFASQLDVTDRIEIQRAIADQKALVEREVEKRTQDLSAALEAKTILLHEVDHRVKNNLTMIGSLLRLQVRTIDDPAIRAKLDTMLERVDALAVVHRQLYQSSNVARFDIGSFTETLANDVIASSGRSDIRLHTAAIPMFVDAAHASALGLILNEILTNAIKHGFADGRSGTLTILVERSKNQGIIKICDDGPGLPSATRSKSIGTALITRLARQVDAEAIWADNSPGTCVTITVPQGGATR
ncbi:PAS domain S-box-containing protein [Novosphingobium chloroacetimidivorans]|uniref:PAS domain S-box-containing protein n=1 Tax=Novosphingobium chloroacetimidivorans TaxID=1428314 RepID=A0A7W7NVP8_9SPHN|nr:histidine kinase dimerization/phosphoacceptor domain -containing protein [Novosphingobium chloroacetimidivorans]MBB4857347.1 PAS domain S-box-containing protein [Novosphingobium chloroacetimidivorans]